MDDKLEETGEEMIESTEGVQPTDALESTGAGGAETNSEAEATGPDTGAEAETKEAEFRRSQELKGEIDRLVEAFSRAAQAAWNSDERRQLQTDLNRGLRRLVENVEEALADFNESKQGQEVREQAEKVVEKVRASKVTADLQQGLTQGLRSVAEEMQEFAERMEKQEQSGDPASSQADAQEIPISKEEKDE